MKSSSLIIVFIILLIIKTIAHFQIINAEKKISKLEKIIESKVGKLELLNINWAFIKRPENLNKINEKNFSLKPIVIEDEIKLIDIE